MKVETNIEQNYQEDRKLVKSKYEAVICGIFKINWVN